MGWFSKHDDYEDEDDIIESLTETIDRNKRLDKQARDTNRKLQQKPVNGWSDQ